MLRTRPATCLDKKGTTGTPIKILCNYFEVLSAPDWELHQYHVDFKPECDSKKTRMGLFNSISDSIFPENKAFDGMTVYSLTLIRDTVERTVTRTYDQAMITITIRRVGSFFPTSPQFLHLFNLVFRRCLKLYGMKQIDRNYFDVKNKIEIAAYNLQMINGFATAIASYEEKLLLCVEITSKLLHKKTVYDLMKDLYTRYKNDQDFREACQREIIGRIVMTT